MSRYQTLEERDIGLRGVGNRCYRVRRGLNAGNVVEVGSVMSPCRHRYEERQFFVALGGQFLLVKAVWSRSCRA